MAAPTVENGPAMESWESVERLPDFQAAAPVAQPERLLSQGSFGNPTRRPPPPPAPPGEVDEAVADALSNYENRGKVLRIEEDILAFFERPDDKDFLLIGTLTTYHRLLAHRVGHYYGLATCIVEVNGQKGCLQLSKGPNACRPELKLANWPVTMQPETAAAPEQQAALRLLRRRSADRVSRPSSVGGDSGSGSASEGRSVQEREQEYLRARARIMGSNGGSPSEGSILAGPLTGAGSSRRNSGGPLRGSTRRNSGSGGQNGGLGRKAVLRNKEEELRDPDFRRAHAAYGQRFDPGFGEDPADQGGQYMRPTYSNHFPELAPRPGVPGGHLPVGILPGEMGPQATPPPPPPMGYHHPGAMAYQPQHPQQHQPQQGGVPRPHFMGSPPHHGQPQGLPAGYAAVPMYHAQMQPGMQHGMQPQYQNMYGQPMPYGSMPVPPPPPGMHYSFQHHQPMQPGLEHMLPGALPGPVVYPGYPHAPPGAPMVMAQHMGQVRPHFMLQPPPIPLSSSRRSSAGGGGPPPSGSRRNSQSALGKAYGGPPRGPVARLSGGEYDPQQQGSFLNRHNLQAQEHLAAQLQQLQLREAARAAISAAEQPAAPPPAAPAAATADAAAAVAPDVPATEEPPRPALDSEPSQREEQSSGVVPPIEALGAAAESTPPDSSKKAAHEQPADAAPANEA